MYVLLTGGAGFIGSHLAERLASAGHEVLVYDAFTKHYDAGTKRRNIAPALGLAGCTLVEGSILDVRRLDAVMSPRYLDAVIHLAGVTGEHVSLDASRECVQANIEGTLNVLEQCRKHRVGRFVYGSTAALYGAGTDRPCREDDPTDRPLSPYAASKKAAETLAALYHHRYALPAICLRVFITYGPRQRPDQRGIRWGRALLSGEPIHPAGDGTSRLDFVHVEDVVRAFERALEVTPGFEVVNVGSGVGVSEREFGEGLARHLGVEPRFEPGPSDPALPANRVADLTRAAQWLGWNPTIDLDEGLRRFAAWLRAQDFEDEA